MVAPIIKMNKGNKPINTIFETFIIIFLLFLSDSTYCCFLPFSSLFSLIFKICLYSYENTLLSDLGEYALSSLYFFYFISNHSPVQSGKVHTFLSIIFIFFFY